MKISLHRHIRNLQKSSRKLEKSAQTEYNNKVSVASAEADRIIKDAHKAVELDREKTVQDLQSEIAGLAVAAAEKVLGESGTKESNQLMYDQVFG